MLLQQARTSFRERQHQWGRTWSTYYRTRNGNLKRLKSMPLRQTREAAQADLDAYAATKRLPAYEVENP